MLGLFENPPPLPLGSILAFSYLGPLGRRAGPLSTRPGQALSGTVQSWGLQSGQLPAAAKGAFGLFSVTLSYHR